MNGRPESVRDRLAETLRRGGGVTVPAVAVFELSYGIAKSSNIAANMKKLDLFLSTLSILPFATIDAHAAAQIRADLERAGQPIGPYDCLIAGQAVRHGLTLVTANAREFARVPGLAWENWAE